MNVRVVGLIHVVMVVVVVGMPAMNGMQLGVMTVDRRAVTPSKHEVIAIATVKSVMWATVLYMTLSVTTAVTARGAAIVVPHLMIGTRRSTEMLASSSIETRHEMSALSGMGSTMDVVIKAHMAARSVAMSAAVTVVETLLPRLLLRMVLHMAPHMLPRMVPRMVARMDPHMGVLTVPHVVAIEAGMASVLVHAHRLCAAVVAAPLPPHSWKHVLPSGISCPFLGYGGARLRVRRRQRKRRLPSLSAGRATAHRVDTVVVAGATAHCDKTTAVTVIVPVQVAAQAPFARVGAIVTVVVAAVVTLLSVIDVAAGTDALVMRALVTVVVIRL